MSWCLLSPALPTLQGICAPQLGRRTICAPRHPCPQILLLLRVADSKSGGIVLSEASDINAQMQDLRLGTCLLVAPMLPVPLLACHGAIGHLPTGAALLQLHAGISLGLAAACAPGLIAE